MQRPAGFAEDMSRAFCQFILMPLNQLMRSTINDLKEKYEKRMGAVGAELKGDDRILSGKPLMRRTVQFDINIGDLLLYMIAAMAPSPRVAQKNCVENLYEGLVFDEEAKVIWSCEKEGTLMMYFSRMVPKHDKRCLCEFGRVRHHRRGPEGAHSWPAP